ncbi:MAG: archaeosine biosynthesis radical SAM protein RaSEA [Candidatus Thorarchaeota archaeon]
MSTTQKIQDEILKASVRARGRSVEHRKTRDPRRPAAKWVAEARVAGVKGNALSIVLSTIGCSHARGDSGGCTMCSYLLDGTSKSPTPEELIDQFKSALRELDGIDGPHSVKIYTSGSFFDPDEIPETARREILSIISGLNEVQEVILETRPEYVTDSVMAEVRGVLGDRAIELGIGLESSSDLVRTVCVNKQFEYDEFRASVETARRHDIGVRAYVLLKPPFLTENEAIVDVKRTIDDLVALKVATISVNPVNVQRNTLVEHLWNRRRYRPPWLWSVVEVLQYAHKVSKGDINIVCDPAAAGKIRGTHNCSKCDKAVVDAIRRFSLDGNPRVFAHLSCDCKSLWKHTLEHEGISLLVH